MRRLLSSFVVKVQVSDEHITVRTSNVTILYYSERYMTELVHL